MYCTYINFYLYDFVQSSEYAKVNNFYEVIFYVYLDPFETDLEETPNGRPPPSLNRYLPSLPP